MGRTKKLKAQITIDCVCLWLMATVSLASVHNSHYDRNRACQALITVVLHRRENIECIGLSKGKSVSFNIIHCMTYNLFCHHAFIQNALSHRLF